jgi:glycogen(starch) synthase
MRILLQHASRADDISGVRTCCEALPRALEALGADVEVLPTRVASGREIWRAVGRADVVHLNSHHIGVVLAVLVRRKPAVLTYHYPLWDELVNEPYEPRGLVHRWSQDMIYIWRHSERQRRFRYVAMRFVRSLFRVAIGSVVDVRLACSRYLAATTDLPFPVFVEYNVLPFPDAPPRANPVARRPSFVYAGRLSKEKGVDLLIEAAVGLRSAGWEFQVDVVGCGEEEGALRELARVRKVDDVVTFHGRAQRAAVKHAMRNALAVVVPSRWNDPAPYVIVEAAAEGCCAVGARRGGIPELVGDPRLLFDTDDAAGLAAVMASLLAAPAAARRRGEAAFERLRALCGSPGAARGILAVYQGLLHR